MRVSKVKVGKDEIESKLVFRIVGISEVSFSKCWVLVVPGFLVPKVSAGDVDEVEDMRKGNVRAGIVVNDAEGSGGITENGTVEVSKDVCTAAVAEYDNIWAKVSRACEVWKISACSQGALCKRGSRVL